MNSNDLRFIPDKLSASTFLALRMAILKHTQKTGLKINKWHIEEIVNDKGEPVRYNFYFENQVEDFDIQKAQLGMEDENGGS